MTITAVVVGCSLELCLGGVSAFIQEYAMEIAENEILYFVALGKGGGAGEKLLADSIPPESLDTVQVFILVGHAGCETGTMENLNANLQQVLDAFPNALVAHYWLQLGNCGYHGSPSGAVPWYMLN